MEAAGVEPASAMLLFADLHTYWIFSFLYPSKSTNPNTKALMNISSCLSQVISSNNPVNRLSKCPAGKAARKVSRLRG